MKSSTTPDFWAAYQVLPERVRNIARKTYQLWQENPAHPSLHWNSSHPVSGESVSGCNMAPWRVCAVTPRIGSGSARTTNSTISLRVLSLSDSHVSGLEAHTPLTANEHEQTRMELDKPRMTLI